MPLFPPCSNQPVRLIQKASFSPTLSIFYKKQGLLFSPFIQTSNQSLSLSLSLSSRHTCIDCANKPPMFVKQKLPISPNQKSHQNEQVEEGASVVDLGTWPLQRIIKISECIQSEAKFKRPFLEFHAKEMDPCLCSFKKAQ